MEKDIYLSSADNPRLKAYRRLASSARERRNRGLFVIEGARLAADAARESARLRSVFFTEAAEKRYGETMALLRDKYDGSIFFGLSPSAAAAISDTESSQGIFAVCETPAFREPAVIKRGGRYIVLDNIQDPGNMGTMLRTADACGIDGVLLCGGCDPFSPKAVRSAMGSVMRVRLISGGFEETAPVFRERDVPLLASVIDPEAEDIRDTDFSRGAAVIIGNEGSGIPPVHLSLASGRITIKMRGSVNSLNAAMAAGIIIWELTR